MGYSWLTGRFDSASGKFNYDADNVSDSNVAVDINTSIFDSNHAERDRHIKGPECLNAPKFGAANFVST